MCMHMILELFVRNARGEALTRKKEVEGRWRNRKRGEGGCWGEIEGGNERVVERKIIKEEVMNALKKMNGGRATGLDGNVQCTLVH